MIFFDIDGTLLDYDAAERNGIIDFFQVNWAPCYSKYLTWLCIWELPYTSTMYAAHSA